ncbi:hypothetical protein [Roseibium sp.]|uniref:hypothetical protein n=1 Tax=Roseibium sp. TaxID=1936156 RepID=UPI003A975F9E
MQTGNSRIRASLRRVAFASTLAVGALVGQMTLPTWAQGTSASPASQEKGQFAETPAARLLSDWIASLNEKQGVTASVGEILPGDRRSVISAQNGRIAFSIPSAFLSGATQVEAVIEFPLVEIDGLRSSGDLYLADSISFPESLDIKIEALERATDDTDTTAAPSTAIPSRFEISYEELLLEGLAFPKELPIPSTGSRPSATLLSYLDAMRKVALARAFVSQATASSKSGMGIASSFVYEDMALIGLADGRISEQSVGRVRVIEELPDASHPTSKVDITFDGVILRGFDMVPLMALLGGHAEAGRNVLLDREEFTGLSFSQDGVTGTIRNILFEDISVTDLSPLRFTELLDRDAAGDKVDEDELGVAALEAIGRFRLGRFELGDLDVTTSDGNGSLRRVLVRDLTGGGLSEVSFDGLNIAATDGSQIVIDHAGITQVALPPLGALLALDNNAEPTTDQILAVMPTIGKMLASAVDVTAPSDLVPGTTPGEQLRSGISLIEIVQGGFVSNIPTRTSVIVDGVTLPTSHVEDPSLRTILEGLDLQEIEINHALSVKWDPESLDLTISNASIHVLEGGTASLSLTLGNVPRSLFTTPQLAEIALAGATVKSGAIRLRGGALLNALLDEQASTAGVSRELFAEGLTEAARGELAIFAGSPFEASLIAALRSFFQDPDEIEVELAPATPVPVTELLGMALSAPQAIPDRLGVRVVTAQ